MQEATKDKLVETEQAEATIFIGSSVETGASAELLLKGSAVDHSFQEHLLGRVALKSSPAVSVRSSRGEIQQEPQRPRSAPVTIPGMLSFDAKTMEEVTPKRKRRRYEEAERPKVALNRGNVCEKHHMQKTKVCIYRLHPSKPHA